MNPRDLVVPPLTAADIERAQRGAQLSGKPVTEVLEEQSGLASEAFVRSLAAALGCEPIDMGRMNEMSPAFDLLPYTEALARACVLFRSPTHGLVLVFADPFNPALRPWAEERVPHALHWALAHASEVSAYLARHGETMRAMDTVLDEAVRDDSGGGRLEELSLRTMAEQVISRIKVMAELDIAERRVPQDGRFKVLAQGREIDFRVSIMPSIFGEDAVLRILDKQSLTDHVKGLSLDALGFDASSRATLRRLSAEPYGMLLVTGPTGSGKTTSLYAAISEINHGFDKLITIEDPVEYQLPGVLQIPVNEKKGLTFARGLRSILRHDPDKIMVGEIRDAETAQIAVQAALTGHLVFTTVHANNVFDVIGRFMHMGVDPYSFVSALNGIAAQRLLRINCMHCAHDVQPEPQMLRESGLAPEAVHDWRLRAGAGCGHCRGTGFRGRKAIAEIMVLNDEIRELIVAREPIRKVKDAARRAGTRFLREAALDLVREGETSLQEINRVTLVA